MPRSCRRAGSEGRFKPSQTEKAVFRERGQTGLNNLKIGDSKSNLSSFDNQGKLECESDLTQWPSPSRPLEVGVAEDAFSPLKSSGPIVSNFPRLAIPFKDKRARSKMITASLMQEESEASQFLSISEGKGRLIRRKTIAPMLGRKSESNYRSGNRLSHAQRLLLFKTLLKKPLPYLEIHSRCGVLRSAMTSLVRNGLLIEMWGPKAVGVRFKLSDKGKVQLRKLEAASRCDPVMRKNAVIRLKRVSTP